MESAQDGIRRTFVDAYPRYVASILTERGVSLDEVVADAIVEGTALLDGLLAAFESTPLMQQTSSPLELFSEALRPIDRALALVGTPVPGSGAGTVRIVPWDRYGLSPGSSQVLGESALEAHIAWGLTKAQMMARFVDETRGPAVGLLCPTRDLEGLVREAETAHYRTVVLPDTRAVTVAVVCASEPDADAVVRAMATRSKVIVYGRSIDDIDQIRFASLGASATIPADRLIGNLAEYLPVVG